MQVGENGQLGFPPASERRFEMRTIRILIAAGFVWIAVMGLPARGQVNPYPTTPTQQGTSPSGRSTTVRPPQPGLAPMDVPPKIIDEQAKSRNIERQKKLEEDTARLLSLATELKEQVDKTNQNIMSLDVIKKADEIERLAKSVKDRMKG
jgi:HAMP domain-containing protein